MIWALTARDFADAVKRQAGQRGQSLSSGRPKAGPVGRTTSTPIHLLLGDAPCPPYWQLPTCSPSMETVVLTTSRPAMAPFDTIVAE
jgi:hypothetical protein